MHPDVAKLMELQKLDVEARKLREEIAALPKAVGALEAKAKAISGQRAVVLELIAKEEALRRRQESDIADQKTKLARGKSKVDAATTTAQVTALEHEISFNQKEIARLEDAELESMVRSEELEAQKAVADKAVADSEEKFQRERERAIGVVDRNNAAVKELDARRAAQRTAILSGGGEAALGVYDRIAKSKGTGVSEALDQKCSACQMLVRPQKWNDLRERDNLEMMTCESCGRLLYYDPARDSPGRKTVETVKTESIAAQIVRGL